MQRAPLFHPRVFDDPAWTDGYYRRNARNIHQMGKRIVGLLKKSGFTGGKILDTGCGFGAVAMEIAGAFPQTEIHGIDLGNTILEKGRSLIEAAGLTDRITLSKGDVGQIDFPDDTFDVVVNTFMLHIVEKPLKMLNEMERVAKPEARILIVDLRRIWLGLFVKKLKTAFTMEEAVDIIHGSRLRPGDSAKGPFWWEYRIGLA